MIIAETQIEDIQYRISRHDKYNVILEKYNPPHLAVKGRNAGGVTEGRWEILGYYSKAQLAAKAIVAHGVSTLPGEFSEVIETLNRLEAAFEKKL